MWYYHVKLPYIPAWPYFFAVNMNSQIDRAEASSARGSFIVCHSAIKPNDAPMGDRSEWGLYAINSL